MICYMGKTFCAADGCQKKTCSRHLDQTDAAPDWMPICLSDYSPTCPDYAPESAGQMESD